MQVMRRFSPVLGDKRPDRGFRRRAAQNVWREKGGQVRVFMASLSSGWAFLSTKHLDLARKIPRGKVWAPARRQLGSEKREAKPESPHSETGAISSFRDRPALVSSVWYWIQCWRSWWSFGSYYCWVVPFDLITRRGGTRRPAGKAI